MNANEEKPQKKTDANNITNAVQQIRPDDSCETMMKPATQEEVREAVEEINPDENTLDRG